MQKESKVFHSSELILAEEFFIRARDFLNAGKASIMVKSMLKEAGCPAPVVRRAAICAYEAEMNVVMYGSDGYLRLGIYTDLICIQAEDHGPGIENLELAMKEGYSTAPPEYREMGFGAGMGLPNMKRNSDHMEIITAPGKGTLVHMDFLMNLAP